MCAFHVRSCVVARLTTAELLGIAPALVAVRKALVSSPTRMDKFVGVLSAYKQDAVLQKTITSAENAPHSKKEESSGLVYANPADCISDLQLQQQRLQISFRSYFKRL